MFEGIEAYQNQTVRLNNQIHRHKSSEAYYRQQNADLRAEMESLQNQIQIYQDDLRNC